MSLFKMLPNLKHFQLLVNHGCKLSTHRSPCYHDSPLRDYVNYPPVIIPPKPAPVRFGFIPDNWFTFFYPKTGVTGPYVFGYGLLAFLLSKEYYIYWIDSTIKLNMIFTTYFVIKYLGPYIQKFFMKNHEERVRTIWSGVQAKQRNIENQLEIIRNIENRPKILSMIGDAKRDCILLQQELEYRKRIRDWRSEIVRRLDFLTAADQVKKEFKCKLLKQWVTDQVYHAFDQKQKDLYMSDCIEQLKLMTPSE